MSEEPIAASTFDDLQHGAEVGQRSSTDYSGSQDGLASRTNSEASKRMRMTCWSTGLLLLTGGWLAVAPVRAEMPGHPATWKFDVVHLHSGRSIPGLLLKENPAGVVLKPIYYNPGQPFRIPAEGNSYLRNEIARIDR